MRQIKKKFVAFLMALVMVLSFPSVAFAAGETPITTAEEFRTAMEGVKAGDEVEFTIAGSFEITGDAFVLPESSSVTIKATDDVTLSTSITDVFTVTDDATLTLGEHVNIESTTSVLWADGGTINVDGASITSSLKHALGFAEKGGIINVKSGTVAGTTANKVTLDAQDAGSQINVTGGKVTSEASSAIAVRSGATVTVSDAAYVETTADAALVAIYADNGGIINVIGGTVKAANEAAVDVNPGGKATITDGEIVGGEGYSAVTSTNEEEDAVQISGGTFSSDIPEEFIVPGCGDFEVQDGKFQVHKHTEEEIPAVKATCTEEGATAGTKCSGCGEILEKPEVIEALGHTEEKIPAVDATCTEEGATAGIKCSVCSEIVKEPEVVEALGHTEEKIPAVDATCTKDGATEGTKCSVCGEIIKAQEVIPAAHTLTEVPAKEATVDAEGNKAYFTCECGKWFEDKDAKTEITDKASVIIPKLEKPEEPKPEEPKPVQEVIVSYNTHVQNYGWLEPVADGEASGTEGESKRLEAIKIEVSGNDNLGISYSTHVQNYGWIESVADGEASGTEGESKRLEAIKIELTGADKDNYNVWYRVHAQNYGWLGWAKNGQPAGTAGQSKRLEAIEIIVLPVGEYPEGQIGYAYIEVGQSADNAEDAGLVNYMTHVQNYGDQSYVYDGSIAGTFGESKRLESISIKLNNELLGVEGGIKYKTHVQNYGWLDFVADGEMSGTQGESKRLEAICIELTGDVAESYDVYYRVHAQTYGWLGWAKNGEEAGTEGLSKRLEAIQIVLVPKGQEAPSVLPGDAGVEPFIK